MSLGIKLISEIAPKHSYFAVSSSSVTVLSIPPIKRALIDLSLGGSGTLFVSILVRIFFANSSSLPSNLSFMLSSGDFFFSNFLFFSLGR